MSKASRKIQRNLQKRKNKQSEKRIKEQMNMFEKIPNSCLTCEKPFDKLNKEDVNSFRVVVRESEGRVNLYCDSCWDKAVNILEEYSEKT